MKPSFDAYQTLMELIDKHNNLAHSVQQMTKNQEQLVKAINSQSQQLDRLENSVKFYKKIIKEIKNENAREE